LGTGSASEATNTRKKNTYGGQACKPDFVGRTDAAVCATWRSFL